MMRINRAKTAAPVPDAGPRGPYAGGPSVVGTVVVRTLGALLLILLAVPFLLAGFCAIELGGGYVSTVQTETVLIALVVAVPGVWLLTRAARVVRGG